MLTKVLLGITMYLMEFRLTELIWDEFNSEHISKHKVNKTEVYEALENVLTILEVRQGRKLLVCQTKSKRYLALVIIHKGGNAYYLVTARDASSKEKRLIYDENKNK